MAHDVYISHSSQDKAIADRVTAALEAMGIRCWIAPRDVPPGARYVEAIIDAISASRLLVLIFSSSANSSRQVMNEVERAGSRGVIILPLRVENVLPSREMEYFLSGMHWLDASTPPLEKHLKQLADTIALILWRESQEHQAAPGDVLAPLEYQVAQRPGLRSVLGYVVGMISQLFSRYGQPPKAERTDLSLEYEICASLHAKSLPELVGMLNPRLRSARTLANLSEETKTALDHFELMWQYVGQFTTLSNPLRKREALYVAMQEMAVLQSYLLETRGEVARRLLEVANAWRAILQSERDHVEAEAEAMREIPNPFIFGNPVIEANSNLFTGRQDIVREIEESILGSTQAPTLLLYGQRRMGKTSILNQLPRLLGPNFLPILVDFQNPATGDSVAAILRYLSRAISNALQGRVSKLQPASGLREPASVEPLTGEVLEDAPFAAFDEWLDGMEQSLPLNLRLLLCMDEYEYLQSSLDDRWRPLFLDALRHWLQHRRHLVLMFTGSHTFEELGPEWTSRFVSTKRLKVSFLTEEDVRPLLTNPVPDFTMTYAPGALAALYRTTNGQPFLTQAVASELVHYLNQQRRKEAVPEDVQTAVDRALTSAGEYFANTWNNSPSDGQEVLRALALGQPPPQLPSAYTWLHEHDMLNAAGDFSVPMMRLWLKNRPRGTYK